MLQGLKESVRGQWQGVVDLGNGSLQSLFGEYQSRCGLINKTSMNAGLNNTKASVEKTTMELGKDLIFLKEGSEQTSKEYNDVVERGHARENKLMELAWSVTGFQELLKKAMDMVVKLDNLLNDFTNDALQICVKIKSNLLKYLKDLYSKKRSPADHLLAFMIANEKRDRKPYALPVQFVPYKSLTDSILRDLELKVEEAMKSENMVVVGKYKV